MRNVKAGLLLATLTLFLLLMFGCTGFFQTPKLTGLTVCTQGQSSCSAPQTDQVSEGSTLQLVAIGNFNDGSTQDLTGKATWTSSATSVVTVKAGLVTPVQGITTFPATATVTAASGLFSSTANVTVQSGPLQSIQLSLTSPGSTTVSKGNSVTFKAQGTFSGSNQPQDITSTVTWTISDTTILPSITSGQGTISTTATSGLQVTVTATQDNITSNPVVLTVQ